MQEEQFCSHRVCLTSQLVLCGVSVCSSGIKASFFAHLGSLGKHIAGEGYGHHLPCLAERLMLVHPFLRAKVIKTSAAKPDESFLKTGTAPNARQGQKMDEL